MIVDLESESSSIDLLDGKKFSIESNAFMFDILRNKMYSDPITACVREIMCNARDAHRAAGKPDLPIEVTSPVDGNSLFKVKDYGPGIPPDIIENVFINYGASTKRGDNIQTGGFGLGAKTPFAYSDSFSIVTIVNGIKYNYVCYINETKEGKISLLHSSNTSEPNGTEIIVKVNNGLDRSKFRSAINEITESWKEDVLVNNDICVNKLIFSEKFLNFSCRKKINTYSYGGVKSYYAIIDGIKYKINNPNIKYIETITALDRDVYLFFENNECSLSANREQLQYDIKTINNINNKLDLASVELFDSINNEINSATSYKEAMKLFSKKITEFFGGNNCLRFIKYKGKELFSNKKIELDYKDICLHIYSRTNRSRNVNYLKERSYSISISDSAMILYNDYNITEEDLNAKHLSLFINKDISDIYVLFSSDLELLKKKIDFDDFNVRPLSKLILNPGKKKEIQSRLNFYKLDDDRFSRISYKVAKEDPNKKLIVKITEDKKYFYAYDKKWCASYYRKNPGISVYGISESIWDEYIDDIDEKFSKLEFYVDDLLSNNKEYLINKKAIENCNKPTFKILYYGNSNLVKSKLIFNEQHFEIIDKIKSLEYKIDTSEENKIAYELASYFCFFDDIKEEINNKTIELNSRYEWINEDKINESFISKYPLLKTMSRYHIESADMQNIVDYMNGIYLLNLRLSED